MPLVADADRYSFRVARLLAATEIVDQSMLRCVWRPKPAQANPAITFAISFFRCLAGRFPLGLPLESVRSFAPFR